MLSTSRRFRCLFCILFLFASSFWVGRSIHAFYSSSQTQELIFSISTSICSSISEKSNAIVIDAGHGGADPGKICKLAGQSYLEKDINLAIAKKLKASLENQSYPVYLTREDDQAIQHFSKKSASKSATSLSPDSYTKNGDLRARVSFITNAAPLCTISIHQNSYPQKGVAGPQVFFYSKSKESESLAHYVQDALNSNLHPKAPRTCKGNSDLFLLKKTPTPTIIVECGFLSNPSEASQLISSDYQEQVAEAITAGILNYLRFTR